VRRGRRACPWRAGVELGVSAFSPVLACRRARQQAMVWPFWVWGLRVLRWFDYGLEGFTSFFRWVGLCILCMCHTLLSRAFFFTKFCLGVPVWYYLLVYNANLKICHVPLIKTCTLLVDIVMNMNPGKGLVILIANYQQ
jgi:hypothetical protein